MNVFISFISSSNFWNMAFALSSSFAFSRDRICFSRAFFAADRFALRSDLDVLEDAGDDSDETSDETSEDVPASSVVAAEVAAEIASEPNLRASSRVSAFRDASPPSFAFRRRESSARPVDDVDGDEPPSPDVLRSAISVSDARGERPNSGASAAGSAFVLERADSDAATFAEVACASTFAAANFAAAGSSSAGSGASAVSSTSSSTRSSTFSSASLALVSDFADESTLAFAASASACLRTHSVAFTLRRVGALSMRMGGRSLYADSARPASSPSSAASGPSPAPAASPSSPAAPATGPIWLCCS